MPTAEQEPRWVGLPLTRIDAKAKITGEAKFFSDMALPGMLHAKVLRSKYPHARIKKISTTKAEKHPGVVAVLTYRDVPGLNAYGIVIPDQPVLCRHEVRYVGDAVALVAAETKEAAEEARNLIDVEYEPLPVVTDPFAAMKDDAPKIHEKGNVHRHARITRGNMMEGFRQSFLVVENEYQISLSQGFDTVLTNDCSLTIIPPVSGG